MSRLTSKLAAFFKTQSLKKDVLATSFFTILGRGSGFLIPFFIAAWFGTNQITDTFFLAFALVLFLEMVVNYIFETVIVPFVAHERSRSGNVGELIGGIVVRSTVALSGISLILMLVAKPLLRLTTNFSAPTVHLSFMLMLEMLPMAFFMTWTAAFNGALNAYKVFHVPVLSTAIRSIVVLLSIFLLKETWGIHSVALGYSLGALIRCLVSYYYFRKKIGLLVMRAVLLPTAGQFFASAFFQTVGYSLLTFLPVVNQMMASWFGPGGLSAYAYAERLRNVPSLLFATGVVSVVLSHWANQYSFDSKNFSWNRNRIVIWKVAGTAAGLFLLSFLFKDLLTALAFKHGEFSVNRLGTVSNLFALMMLSLPFDMIILLCVRLLIIFKQDAYYMVLAFVKLGMNVLLNYGMMSHFGILGIALSTTLVNFIFALVFYNHVRHLRTAEVS